MRKRNILLAPLLIALCGCQPEVPKEYAANAKEWMLASEKGCFQCHTTGHNRLGPAWESVSERYKNNPDAEAHLVNKIKNGGNGAWINTKVMPAFSDDLLTDENRKALTRFILSLK